MLSGEGKTLTGRAVDWTSLQENIAQVDNTGMVQGIAAGVATIRAISGEASGTATITVTAAPALSLAPADITFSAVQAGATPGDRTVTIMNGGTGALTGLTATVRYAASEPNGWLTASLASTSAPTTLVLVANQGNFTPGTYNATVDIASSTPGVATRSVTAHLTVLPPSPAIGLGANSVSFTASQGGADPAPQQVGLTNAGGGSLTDLSTSIDYGAGQRTGWLTATLSETTAPAQLTLRAATAGVPAGNYSANVRVTSPVALNNPQTVAVNFTVNVVQAALALSQQTLNYQATPGGSPQSQTVQLTSQSSTQIGELSFAITYGGGQPTDWASASLSSTTTPANLTVSAAPGSLPAGIYSATITITSPNATNSPQTINLNLNIVDPLNAPTGLSATAVSSSQIDLAWTASAGGAVTRYRIERKTGATGTYAVIDSTTSTSYQNTGLSPLTQYFYRVSACNSSTCSPPSTEANATTASAAPGAPSNVAAIAQSATQINVSWSAVPGTVDSYTIERRTAGGTHAVIGSVSKDSLVFRNTGLTPSTQYFYQVRACTVAAGCSNPSAEVNATTFAPPPSAPTGLNANVASYAQVDLSWNTPSSGTVTIYRIERQDPGNSFQEIAQVPGGTTSYSSTGLSGLTTYNYRVRACNPGGCSGYSNAVTVVTPIAPPANLTATLVSSSQIDLSWSASNGALYYVIERQISSGPFIQIATPTGTSYSDMGLNSGTQYSYRVKACSATACSVFSAPVSPAVTPNTPGAPTNLQAAGVSSSQINLTWTAPTSGTVTNYRIERQAPGAAFVEIAAGVTGTSYSNTTGLIPGAQYSYQVRACNSGGCSPYSGQASAQTVPDVPSQLSASAQSSFQVNLTWNAATGVVSTYNIERRPGMAGTFTQIGTVPAGTLSYTDGTVMPDSQYGYRVRTCTGTPCSGYSNTANVKTPKLGKPSPPSGLTASAVSSSQINLAWSAASGSVAWHIIERSLPGSSFVQIDSISASATSYASTGLADSTTYNYRVFACNTAGCSGHSNTATATTLLAIPSVPQNLTASSAGALTNQINLSWSASTGRVVRYEIEARRLFGSFSPLATVSPPAVTYQHKNLTPLTFWTYQVRACNSAGCSNFSNSASAISQ